jgi:hypothetical protein
MRLEGDAMSRWIDAGAVVLGGGLLLLSGCKKAEPPQADSSSVASAKATASASASAAAASAQPGGFAKGETLEHMPPACKQARIYVDAAGFATLAGAAVQGLEDQWAAALGPEDGKTVKKVLGVLKDGGFDPATSVKELAVCVNEGEDDMVFAVGMDLSKIKGDPLDLILKAAAAAGEKDKAQKKQDGKLSYLLPKGKDDEGAAAVFGSSLVVGKDLKALKVAQKGGGAAGFKNAAKSLVYLDIAVAQGQINGAITDAGKDLKLVGSMKLTGQAAAELKKDATATIQQMKGMVDEMAGELAKAPPFKDLAEPLKALKLSADGETLKAELTIPKQSLQKALKATSEMKPEDLMQLMK